MNTHPQNEGGMRAGPLTLGADYEILSAPINAAIDAARLRCASREGDQGMTTPMNTGFTSFESLRSQVSLCGVLRLPEGQAMPGADVELRRGKPAAAAAGTPVRGKAGAGLVRNANSASIIKDTDEKNALIASTSTRSDGSFYFMDLPEGTYTLRCSAVWIGTGREEFVRLQALKNVLVNRLQADPGKRTKPTVVEVVLQSASLSSTGRRPAAAATEPDKG